MDLPRPSTNGKISVPVEIVRIIIKFLDRCTRAQLRLCSQRMCDIASPFVFDALRIEIETGSPTNRSLASFEQLWLSKYKTQSLTIDAGIRPCHDLQPMVRSVTFARDNDHVDHLCRLLKVCPNLFKVYFQVLHMKFPGTQSLDIRQHNPTYSNNSFLPVETPIIHHQLWTQLATIDIRHGAHAEIVRALEYLNIVSLRSARTVQLNIHNPTSTT
ncbi:hypothetical protein BC940DRAFT_329278 [Gongronella butleri]|nr:hypothetical protein BC940DRAFT_329278 [Gongronella butleri]